MAPTAVGLASEAALHGCRSFTPCYLSPHPSHLCPSAVQAVPSKSTSRPFAACRAVGLAEAGPFAVGLSLRPRFQIKSAATDIENRLVSPEKIFSDNPTYRMTKSGLEGRYIGKQEPSAGDIFGA